MIWLTFINAVGGSDLMIVSACLIVLILILLNNICVRIDKYFTAVQNKEHKIARNEDENEEHNFALNMYQQKEHNIARIKAPKFPPFFFGMASALAVQLLILMFDQSLLGTKHFPAGYILTSADRLDLFQRVFLTPIIVPIFLVMFTPVFPPILLAPVLFVYMIMVAYSNSHRSWAWGLYFVTFLTWFIGSLFAAHALDNFGRGI